MFVLQIVPSLWRLGDLQTSTQTDPLPLTRILNVGALPTGTVWPLLGDSGVMPFEASATPASEAASTPAASRAAAGRRSERGVMARRLTMTGHPRGACSGIDRHDLGAWPGSSSPARSRFPR